MRKYEQIRPKIAIVITSVYQLAFFLVPHIKMLSEKNEITLFLNNDAPNILRKINIPAKIIELPIQRKIHLFKDLLTLFLLIKFFFIERFYIVHTFAPKAGLLGIIASYLTFTPKRVHTFQGEVWTNYKGFKKFFYKFLDKLIYFMSTHVIIVSKSGKEHLLKNNVINKSKSYILGAGSIGGVDLKIFNKNESFRKKYRKEFNYNSKDIVFMYFGRVCYSKGVVELALAFKEIQKNNQNFKLLIMGPIEDNSIIKIETILKEIPKEKIKICPYSHNPEKELHLPDILVFPSYKEGFGVVAIEAAAMEIPTIGSNVIGIKDAIIDGKTGLLFNVNDFKDLAKKMLLLSKNKKLRLKYGFEARKRVEKDFSSLKIIKEFQIFYNKLLSS
jgi:glycosyltransferase involved in cell wall biosynthesis